MDCRDPEYMDVRIESQSPYYEAYSDATSTIHGNWFPAVHAGMTVRLVLVLIVTSFGFVNR